MAIINIGEFAFVMALIKNIKDKIESVNEPDKVEKIIETAARDIKREKAAKERGRETLSERAKEKELFPLEEQAGGSEMAAYAATAAVQKKIKEREKKVEKILEENLEEIYINLSPAKQAEFRAKGEETARAINAILEKAKFKIKDIISLIKKWLSVIPGVNKFFLDQEAKIKADKILSLKK